MNHEISGKPWSFEDEYLQQLLQPGRLKKLHSKNPLAILKRKLKGSMVWAVLITAGYIILLFQIKSLLVLMALIVLILFNLYIMFITVRLILRIEPDIRPRANLLDELRRHYNDFMQWWDIQRKTALFIYPVAASGGFIYGGLVGSGKTVPELFEKPVMWIFLLVSLLVLVPLCHWMAKWMFRLAYGKHLQQLKENIDALEQEAA
ncbi:MAG: hypothetical protein GC171_11045 [Terrimonas sp.]|nr:hypothetical protein [Terrimonas sp.]